MRHEPRIEFHHDFSVLEERLAGLLADLKASGGPLTPAAVVAPTRRLIIHLQETLAARLPALLNVRFFHHDALAHAMASAAGNALPRVSGEAVLGAILGTTLEAMGGDLAAYARRRPGSVTALLCSMDDLREAGVEADSIDRERLSPAARRTMELYARHLRALDRLAAGGLADRAGMLAAARAHASAFGSRFDLVVHYGAYELIGVNLDLMRALEDTGARVIYLAPGHPTAPAYAYARRFWPAMTGARPAAVAGPEVSHAPSRLLADRLPLLYDEESPVTGPRAVDFFHAQGEAAELHEVALRIVALLGARAATLERIAVVARSLEPYAPHLETVFREHGLPFNTTSALGAAREPAAQAALRLAHCVLEDYPARSLFDLLGGGLLSDPECDPAREADAWERLSREGRFAGGYETWTRRLPDWVAAREPWVPPAADEAARAAAVALRDARVRQAAALAGCVRRLAKAARTLEHARCWDEWAKALRALLEDRLAGFGAAAPAAGADVVGSALDDMRALDASGVPFSAAAALLFLDRAVTAARIPIGSVGADGVRRPGDQGGVRILDAMQARGLSFDALFIIGMNVDLFPRRPREDPFLPDDDRRLLRETLRRPVPIIADAMEEEHLLLAHLLGAARERLTISWQRADEGGRARVPSLALREVARVTLGVAEWEAAGRVAVRVSAHPSDRGEDAVRRLNLVSPAGAGILVGLMLKSPAALAEAIDHLPPEVDFGARGIVAPGLAFLAAIENGAAAAAGYDALLGAGLAAPPEAWSPSRLEILGSCPQQHFFRQILGAEEWEEPLEAHEIEAREMGAHVHAVLRDVYAALLEEGVLPGDTGAAPERAVEHLGAAWRARTARLAAQLRPVYPLLWDLISAQWLAALERFVRRDLGEMTPARLTSLDLERTTSAPVPLEPYGFPLPVRGRFDRLARFDAGIVVVADYKTSGHVEDHVSLRDALQGTRLQMALYVLLAETLVEPGAPRAGIRAEVLGVGPSYERDDGAPPRATIDPVQFDKIRDGLLETLAVLRDLAAGGLFPLNEHSRLCRFCPFTRACRKDHPPTLERLAARGDLEAWRGVRRKSTLRPTLAEVAASTAAGAEAE